MVGATDHATLLKQVNLKDQELEFLSPKNEEGFHQDTLFQARVTGDGLAGTASSPEGSESGRVAYRNIVITPVE